MTAPAAFTASQQGGTAARVRWTVEILTRPEGEQVEETSWVEVFDAVGGDADRVRSRTFAVEPGAYLVAVTGEDERSGESHTARQEVQVPSGEAEAGIVDVRVERRAEGGWEPLVSPEVTVGGDSLRLWHQTLNATARPLVILAERLAADSSVAEPPFGVNRQPDALAVRGVVVPSGVRDTAFVRRVEGASELAEGATGLPRLGTGTYRIRAEVGGPSQDRFLVVRRAGFPAVERIGDLIEAMRYITDEGEMRALTARADPFLQRRAFDRFWGDRIPDRRLAAAAVRAYAERVENANRWFSNQKEGWRTDRGMAFVLFGPPQRVERRPGAERWTYTSGPVSGLALEFVASEGLPDGWPYPVWVLRRGPAYDVAWQRARRAWRRGDVP